MKANEVLRRYAEGEYVMTENKEPGRRDIKTDGNYNERIEGDYINVYIINIPSKENELKSKRTDYSSKDGEEKTESQESQNISSPTIQQRELQQNQDQIKDSSSWNLLY